MIDVKCPNCEREYEVNEYDGEIYNGLEKTHLVPLIIPILKQCDCGEKYIIDYDCDYDDAVLVVDFYEFNKTQEMLKL